MSDADAAIPPLVVDFEVPVDAEHAFEVWTSRAALWWPPGHTVSGRPEAIVFEPRRGGRIYERDGQDGQHTWGEILHWEPPVRITFLWHLFFARSEATRVELTFTPTAGGTVVRLVQTGWEALGDAGAARRERTVGGWATVTAAYGSRCSTPTEESA